MLMAMFDVKPRMSDPRDNYDLRPREKKKKKKEKRKKIRKKKKNGTTELAAGV